MTLKPNEGEIVYKHFRYVDPAWRAQKLEALVGQVFVLRDVRDPDDEFDCLMSLVRLIKGIDRPDILLGTKVGPFLYSRGTHLLPDKTEERNTFWRPDPVGGMTVAAVFLDGESYCVFEPCVAPDAYSYKRGREIARGRLREGLAEMGIKLP